MLLSAPSGQCGAALRGEGLASGAAARLGEALEGALVLVELLDDRGMSRERWGAQWLDLAAEGEPPFWAAPHCFSQANLELNEALRARVRAWASEALADRTEEVTEEPRLVELFAGSGNLTRELASLGSVVAVESDPRAVALGRLNLEDRSITWRQQEAAEALKSGLSPQGPPSLVVLDPPRSGARELLDGLSALAPQRILYVSCDAMTLARDVAILACEGYLPTRVEALDTLPQTAHFEMVVDLRRGSRLRR
jgi:23S rRNA (uracil1939-C5)-methyltransferase